MMLWNLPSQIFLCHHVPLPLIYPLHRKLSVILAWQWHFQLQNHKDLIILCYFLFKFQLGSGFVTAEATLSNNSNLSKLFCDCKEYVIATCQSSSWVEKVDELCQVRLNLTWWRWISLLTVSHGVGYKHKSCCGDVLVYLTFSHGLAYKWLVTTPLGIWFYGKSAVHDVWIRHTSWTLSRMRTWCFKWRTVELPIYLPGLEPCTNRSL